LAATPVSATGKNGRNPTKSISRRPAAEVFFLSSIESINVPESYGFMLRLYYSLHWILAFTARLHHKIERQNYVDHSIWPECTPHIAGRTALALCELIVGNPVSSRIPDPPH